MPFGFQSDFPRIRIDRFGGRAPASGQRYSDRSGQRERLQIRDTVRQVAESLAEEERRRQGAEGVRADRLAAGVSHFPSEPSREDGLARLVLIELVLEADLEIAESFADRFSVGRYALVFPLERNAEVGSDALRKFRGKRLFPGGRLLIGGRALGG